MSGGERQFRFLDNDSAFGTAVGRVLSLCALNIIWLVLSCPIITVGASTASLHYALHKLRNGEAGVVRSFFSGWKKCWKQATLVWLLILLFGAFLIQCFWIASMIPGTIGRIVVCLFCIPAMLLLLISCYSFPLIARFELSFLQLVTDSVLLSLAYFPRSLLILVINLLPFLIIRFAPAVLVCVFFVWIPIGFAFAALLIQRILTPTWDSFE